MPRIFKETIKVYQVEVELLLGECRRLVQLWKHFICRNHCLENTSFFKKITMPLDCEDLLSVDLVRVWGGASVAADL